MGETVPDKNVEIDGRTVGANTTLKLSVKTAFWIISGIVGVVMTILTWSYFDLKSEVAAFEAEEAAKQKEFIEHIDEKLDKVDTEVHTIRIDQATIKGDIRLILDRQNRDNPIVANPNRSVNEVTPPPGE